MDDSSSLQEDFSHASCVPCFHHSWEDSSTTCFHQCVILRRTSEYNHIAIAFHPMMPTIPSENTIVAMFQLHPPPSNLNPSPIFDYLPKHTFVLDRTLFAQTFNHYSHLFLGGLFKMVYEHFSRCFIPKNPSSWFSELFQTIVIVIHGNIPRSVVTTLVLGSRPTQGLA